MVASESENILTHGDINKYKEK